MYSDKYIKKIVQNMFWEQNEDVPFHKIYGSLACTED